MPYETFDKDLREGKAREDAFVHVLLRSRVEHKRDKKAARTGNVAIEVAQKCRDGEHHHAGVFATDAEYFAVEFFPECWLLMPTEYVRILARRAMKEDRHRWIGDGENHLNALVPIEWFVRLAPNETDAAWQQMWSKPFWNETETARREPTEPVKASLPINQPNPGNAVPIAPRSLERA